MRAVVKKWGNSASVRIPAGVKGREFDIDHLIAGITPQNLHSEVDYGAPIGKELL